jgi:hypothetical protein
VCPSTLLPESPPRSPKGPPSCNSFASSIRIPAPPLPPRRPGRPLLYSDRLFLKALLIMIVRRLHRVHELLAVLAEPTQEIQEARKVICERGRFPSRRTFERRLKALPETLLEQIGCLGRYLVEMLGPWAHSGRAVA